MGKNQPPYLGQLLPSCCATAAGVLILVTLGWGAWPLWPLAVYGVGLAIGWWPMRPKEGAGVRWGVLVLASVLQTTVYALVALSVAPMPFEVPLPAWIGEYSVEVCFAAALVGGPAVGLLAVVAARRGVVMAVTQLLVPFVGLLWYLALSLASAW